MAKLYMPGPRGLTGPSLTPHIRMASLLATSYIRRVIGDIKVMSVDDRLL